MFLIFEGWHVLIRSDFFKKNIGMRTSKGLITSLPSVSIRRMPTGGMPGLS